MAHPRPEVQNACAMLILYRKLLKTVEATCFFHIDAPKCTKRLGKSRTGPGESQKRKVLKMSKAKKVLFALVFACVVSLLFAGCVTEAESQVIMGEAVENANQDPALDAVEPESSDAENSDAQVPVRRGAKSQSSEPAEPVEAEEPAPETVEESEPEIKPVKENDDKWAKLKILPGVIKKVPATEDSAPVPESPPEEGAKVKAAYGEHEDAIARLLAGGIDTLESAPMPEPTAPLTATTDEQEEAIEDEQILPNSIAQFFRYPDDGTIRVQGWSQVLEHAVEKYDEYSKYINDNQNRLGFNTADIERLASEPSRFAIVVYGISGAVNRDNLASHMLAAEYAALTAYEAQTGEQVPIIYAKWGVYNTRVPKGSTKMTRYTDERSLARFALMATETSGVFTSCANPFVFKPEPPPEPRYFTLTIRKRLTPDSNLTGISAEEVFGITVPHGIPGIPEEYSLSWQEGQSEVKIVLPENSWYSVNETWMPGIYKFSHYSGDAPQGHITKDIVVEIWNRRMLPDEPPVVVVPPPVVETPDWQIIKKIRVVKDGVELAESSPEFQAAAKETFRTHYSINGVYGVVNIQHGKPVVLKGVPENGVGLMNYREELTSEQLVAGWQYPPLDPVADLKARTTTYTNTLILTTSEPEPEYGSVIVDKNLVGRTAKTNMDATFNFTANVYGAPGELLRTEQFSLGIREGVNDTYEIKFVPYGGYVSVEEHLTMPEGFSPDVALEHTVSVAAAIPNPVMVITNHWTDPVVAVGSIELGKIARSAALNVPWDTFTFHAQLIYPDGGYKELWLSITGYGYDWDPRRVSFPELQNLPIGTEYVITEVNLPYNWTVIDVVNQNGASVADMNYSGVVAHGRIGDSNPVYVDFVNHYQEGYYPPPPPELPPPEPKADIPPVSDEDAEYVDKDGNNGIDNQAVQNDVDGDGVPDDGTKPDATGDFGLTEDPDVAYQKELQERELQRQRELQEQQGS